MKNTIAKLIKIYAIINGIACIILALVLSSSDLFTNYSSPFYEQGFPVFVFVAGTGIVVSFGIYALGEIIDLLQGIKDNTSGNKSGGIDELDTILPPL
ncbi:hypothetical protein E9840_12190 [Tissierella creatinini]|nr:hypothetical protein E9840_12190 [Tissierella creatinini]TJX59279.1 hypothetical protein E8P77_21515 [Soehngenia saccharolytica]